MFICLSLEMIPYYRRIRSIRTYDSLKAVVSIVNICQLTVLRRWSRCCSYSVKCCSLHYEALHVWSCPALCLCVSFSILSPCLGKRELVFVLIVHLFVSLAHVNLCHYFSSSWCRGLAAASSCGSSWTFLFTLFKTFSRLSNEISSVRFN